MTEEEGEEGNDEDEGGNGGDFEGVAWRAKCNVRDSPPRAEIRKSPANGENAMERSFLPRSRRTASGGEEEAAEEGNGEDEVAVLAVAVVAGTVDVGVGASILAIAAAAAFTYSVTMTRACTYADVAAEVDSAFVPVASIAAPPSSSLLALPPPSPSLFFVISTRTLLQQDGSIARGGDRACCACCTVIVCIWRHVRQASQEEILDDAPALPPLLLIPSVCPTERSTDFWHVRHAALNIWSPRHCSAHASLQVSGHMVSHGLCSCWAGFFSCCVRQLWHLVQL